MSHEALPAMPRPLWKGSIAFGLVNIPVSLYPAEERSDLHFRMLDSRNNARIRYERVNEETGEEVAWKDIVKAYEYENGSYVLLHDEDFEAAAKKGATQKTVEIEDFVDRASIDPIWFDKPYYLVPEKSGQKGYVLLREALRETGKVGIAKVVIRTRQHLAAVIPEGEAMSLVLLRFAQEMRPQSEYEFPGAAEDHNVSKKELDLAKSLVEGMTSEWEPEKYEDEYRDALMQHIQERIRKGELARSSAPPEEDETIPEGPINIMELLQRSVEQRGEGREAEPAKQRGASKKSASRSKSGKPSKKPAAKKKPASTRKKAG